MQCYCDRMTLKARVKAGRLVVDEPTDLSDIELLPSARRTALTLAADLKAEQTLDTAPDPVVVRLDDSAAPGFVDKLDETRVDNRAHEIVVHGFTTESLPSEVSGPFRIAILARR